jgi:putative endonuclease
MKGHFSKHGARTTRTDPPISLAYSEQYPTYKEAFRREQPVKRWSRARREALINGSTIELKRLAKCGKTKHRIRSIPEAIRLGLRAHAVR